MIHIVSRYPPSVYDDDVDLLFLGGEVKDGSMHVKGLLFWAGKHSIT